MDRLEYISLLKSTLITIVNSTESAIKGLSYISDSEFEARKPEFMIPSTIIDYIQKLEDTYLLDEERKKSRLLNSTLIAIQSSHKAKEEAYKATIEKSSYDYNLLVEKLVSKDVIILELQKELVSCIREIQVMHPILDRSMRSKKVLADILEREIHIHNTIDEIYG